MNRPPSRVAHLTADDDRGFTLIEALVALVIFGVAISVLGSAVNAVTRETRQADGVSLATDQARHAFQRLDKQVRYAEAITIPGPGVTGGDLYVEFALEDGAYDSGHANKDLRCQQWRFQSALKRLQTRSWRVNGAASSHLTAWATVASGLVNSSAEEPFRHVNPSGALHQGLEVELLTQRSGTPPGSAHLKATFFARNTHSYTTNSVCAQVPRSN